MYIVNLLKSNENTDLVKDFIEAFYNGDCKSWLQDMKNKNI